jgi:hypothetical protein
MDFLTPIYLPFYDSDKSEVIILPHSVPTNDNLVITNKNNPTIENLNLSIRAYNCLKRAKINTLDDLIKSSAESLLTHRNFGVNTMNEIESVLEERGLYFGININLKTPNVFILSSNSFENILLSYSNNIWGCKTNKSNLNRFEKNVNYGDYILIYCSEENKKGFYLMGVVNKKFSIEETNDSIWGEEYGGLIQVEWFNKPTKNPLVYLDELKILFPNYQNGWKMSFQVAYMLLNNYGLTYNSINFQNLIKKFKN